MTKPLDLNLDTENMQLIRNKTEKLKTIMQEHQTKFANTERIGEAGAGLVKVTMIGNYIAKSVHIDPSLLQEDTKVLEELIVAAINDATNKIGILARNEVLDIIGSIQE